MATSTWSRIVAAVVVAAASAGVVAPRIVAAQAAPARDITQFACPSDLDTPFTDVEGTTHEVAIECLYEFGVANGTTATTFVPAGNVTRAQLATLIARTLAFAGRTLDPADAGFEDLGGTVHTDAINALANLGVITGKSETDFDPDGLATRAQTASIVARSIPEGLPDDPPDAFTDDDGATAHHRAINQLAAVGIVTGVSEDQFDPDGFLSRGASSSVVARALDFMVEQGSADAPLVVETIAAALIGQEEAPGPGDNDAFGSARLEFGAIPGRVCVEWDIDGPLSADVTAAHVHVGPRDVPGPILLTLPTPEAAAGERLVDRQCISGVNEGMIQTIRGNPGDHYVNVHTEEFPDGAIRGQLRPFEASLGTLLIGSEEVPGPGEAGGGGVALVDVYESAPPAPGVVCVSLVYDGDGTPTAAHIHEGSAGEAGPIVITLPPFNEGGPVADGCVHVETQVLLPLLANPEDHYVNVHTTAFPDGAVRGQLEARTFLAASLSGDAEVPGPGDDDGDGFAGIDIVGDGRLCADLFVRRLDRVTAAHIHDGATGAAGPIVVTLPAPIFGTSSGCVNADQALVDNIVANPAVFYVNVHTQAFPDGAVRGQLAAEE